MDKWLTTVLVKEIKVGKWHLAPLDLLVLIGMTVSGIMLRVTVADAYPVLENFMDYVSVEAGIRMISYLFDWAIAILLSVMVYHLTKHKIQSFLAYGIAFVLPVFVSASAMWSLGDSIYLFFALLSLSFYICGKRSVAVLVLGISVFFHLNGLFLLPLYVLAYLQGKIKLPYFISPMAAVILHFVLAKGNYFVLFQAENALLQQRESKLLSYNCPNVFYLIGPDKFVNEYEKVALFFALGLNMILVLVLLKRQFGNTSTESLEIALLLCLFLPFVLPWMNERSLLLACGISLLYGSAKLQRFWMPIVLTIITYISYSAFFRGESAVPLTGVAFVVFFLIAYMVRKILDEIAF